MGPSELLLSVLSKIGEPIKGRTMLQKIVFILGHEFPEAGLSVLSYTKYYYGPFSRILEDLVEDAELGGLIHVIPKAVGTVVRYDISVSDEGINYAESNLESTAAQLVERMAARARDLNGRPLSEVISEAYRIAGQELTAD